jgi:predicted site-specific integrase-resolvase
VRVLCGVLPCHPLGAAVVRRTHAGDEHLRVQLLDEAEVADDLVRDMVEVLTSFCARRYGRPSAGRKAKAAFEATQVTP